MSTELAGAAEAEVLEQALRRIARRQGSHSLIVSDGLSERIFYFTIGGVRVIGSGERTSTPIGHILVRQGKLTYTMIEEGLRLAKSSGLRLGEQLVEMCAITPGDVEAALRQKVEEELLSLFAWDSAELRLVEGQPPEGFYAERWHSAHLTCDVGHLIDTILSRVEGWRRVCGRLPRDRDVYQSAVPPSGSPSGDPESRLLSMFDGTSTTAAALRGSRIPWTKAYDLLVAFMNDGRVKRVVGRAARDATRANLRREVQALERSLEHCIDARIVRARLAATYEALGEKARAALQWRDLGDEHRRGSDFEVAIDRYRNCLRLEPMEFQTLEAIVEIHALRGDNRRVLADGRSLVQLLVKHHLFNRARSVLDRLIAIEPRDASLHRQMATVLLAHGDDDGALRELRLVAEILELNQAPDHERLPVYTRILALGGGDRRMRKTVDQITGLTRHRRVLALMASSTLLVLGLVGAGFWYEAGARRSAVAEFGEAERLVKAGGFEQARILLEDFAHRHPLASASIRARQLANRVHQMELEHSQRTHALAAARGEIAQPEFGEREIDLDVLAREEALRDAESRAMADRAAGFLAAGRLEEAHKQYAELIEKFPTADVVEELRVPLLVRTVPPDARVFVDGEQRGVGAATVMYDPAGSVSVRVERDGFDTFEREFTGLQPVALPVALAKPVRWSFAGDAAFDAPPLVVGDRIYVAGRDRSVSALSADDGSLIWRTVLGFYSDVGVAPVATSSGLVVGTAAGEVLCLDAETGDVLWRRELGAPAGARPLLVDDTLLYTGEDGSLEALASADGESRWRLPAGSCFGGTAAVPLGDGVVACLSSERLLRFRVAATGESVERGYQVLPLRATPALGAGRIWALTLDGSVQILSAQSGVAEKRFSAPFAAPVTPCVEGDVAYLVGSDQSLHAFRSSGERLFRTSLSATPTATPAYADGRLVVPVEGGAVLVLDAETGETLWRHEAGGAVTSTPVVSDGVVFVPTGAGRLVAVEL